MTHVCKASLGLLFGVALLTVISFRYPPLLGNDYEAMCVSWDHFQRTGEFNRWVSPDPQNIAHDQSDFLGWWSPGPQVLTGIFEMLGLPIGWGVIFWCSAGLIIQLWGYRRLYAMLGFDTATIAWSLVSMMVGWHTLYAFRQFQGGDPFIGALLPWVCVAMLSVQGGALRSALLIGSFTLIGALIKLSFVIAGIGLCASLCLGAILAAKQGKTSWRTTFNQVGSVAFGLLVAWGLLHWVFLSRGATPATAYATMLTVGGCTHAAAMAFVLPLCSIFALVSSLGAWCDFAGWPHLENNPALLGGTVIVSIAVYILIWRATPRGQARVFFMGFGLIYFFAFTGLYAMQAAVSYEDRHFRPLALFLLPAFVAIATVSPFRLLRLGFATIVVFGAVWGAGSYVVQLRNLIKKDNRSMRYYSLRNLPAETERRLAAVDACLTTGNNLFLTDEMEAMLAIRHNRVGQLEQLHAGAPLRGRVDTLVVILSPQTGAFSKLAAFAGYDRKGWHSRNVHGWWICWQGPDNLCGLPSP